MTITLDYVFPLIYIVTMRQFSHKTRLERESNRA